MDHRPAGRVLTVIAVALTFASGAMDVASFTRLGNVFTSVMTGNIVLWGLAAARGSLTLASHTAVAVAGYIAGVAGGSRIAVGVRGAGARGAVDAGRGGGAARKDAGGGEVAGGKNAGGKNAGGKNAEGKNAEGKNAEGVDAEGKNAEGKNAEGVDAEGMRAEGVDAGGVDGGTRAGEGRAGGWPAHVTWALLAELCLLGGFAVGWEITGAKPGGWGQFCLLAAAAAGMGVQSSAVKNMGLTEVSTTYLTGTLTGLVSSLVSPGPPATDRWRRLGVLLGLAAGASLTGLLVATAPDGVPALPLAALITCVVLAWPPRAAGQARGNKGGAR
jgi:uncharacterized membrane protein YoaK (UPF0700 family)